MVTPRFSDKQDRTSNMTQDRSANKIERAWRTALLAVMALMLALTVAPAHADGQRLETWDFSALPGNKVQIRLGLAGVEAEPNMLTFSIDNPARIALDFPGTASAVPRQKSVGVGVVRSINAVEAGGRTRVVLNLDRMVPYETRIEDGNVYIIVEGAASRVAQEHKSEFMMGAASAAQARGAAARQISNIDFNRGQKGEGRILVTLTDASTPVNVEQAGRRITVDFMNARLPEEFRRRMEVVDFATPVTRVDSFTEGDNVRLVIHTEGLFEHLAYQADDTFTIEVKPVTPEQREKQRKEEYTGERLSLNFQDIEVRAVLQIIADFTGMNLVTSDSVTGNVTLRLQNVPWDQALDIVLKSRGLDMRQVGNVIMVAPAQEIAAREKQEYESLQQLDELAPLQSDLIQVNYAKAEDMAILLKAKENSMLSERGNVTVDHRTNSLLVRDTADKLVDIRNLISRLDIPVRQVLIESRVVVANDDFSRDLGARLGATAVRSHSGSGIIGTSGSLEGTGQMVDSAPMPVNFPSLNNRLNVNLPAASTSGTPANFAVAVLGSDYLIDLELSAMQAEGRGEVISTPRVITSNQNQASIEQGVEIPYLTAASSGATTVQFKKAVLGLTVKPHITPDDRIILDLSVSKDSVGQVFQGVPSVDTREVVTQVLVNNGETVVLGGIYEQERAEATSKVPLLGDLPIIGALFRQNSRIDRKNELLIFVTPKILKDTLTMR
jgi:type IV pilus assembly protein PilQ